MVSVGGRSSPLSGPADRAAFMAMRAVTDVILVGAGTVRAENYGPVRLEDTCRERRLARGQARPPGCWRSSATGPTSSRRRRCSPAGPKPLILTSAKAAAGLEADLAALAEMRGVRRRSRRSDSGTRRTARPGPGPGALRRGSDAAASRSSNRNCWTSCAVPPRRLWSGPGHRSLTGDGAWPEPFRLRLTRRPRGGRHDALPATVAGSRL